MEHCTILSSESVTEGHPDKICDTISDAILDLCLAQDPKSRVACETLVKDDLVILAGEITTNSDFNYQTAIYETIKKIGYTDTECKFQAERFHFLNALGQQSQDIRVGVDAKSAIGKTTDEQGAGDQGLMFGYATNETPELMPAPILYAHKLSFELTRMRKEEATRYPWLRPDGKTQVSVKYKNGKPECITAVVVSTMHSDTIDIEELRQIIKTDLIDTILAPTGLLTKETEYHINPTGRFVTGGPEGDCGLTGRKIIVDTYGGVGRHGGGAFSGKDPSKVDRSATYMCRWVAKNIVAAKLADKCEIQVAYAIGYPSPVSIAIDTFGTGKYSDDKIIQAVNKIFSFKPADIIQELDLLRPIYSKTTNYGHFGRENADLPWEKVNRVDQLLEAINNI